MPLTGQFLQEHELRLLVGAGIQTESTDSGAGNEANSQVLALHYTSPGEGLKGRCKCGEMRASQIEENKNIVITEQILFEYDIVKDNQS